MQKLASGQTHAQRYGAFGTVGSSAFTHPARVFGMFVGEPGSGKTRIFHDHEGALHINLDMTSSPVVETEGDEVDTPPKYQSFPMVGTQGPVDANGNTLVLRWEHVTELVLGLIEAAKNDRPRPETIIIDSTTSALDLLMDWAARNWQKLRLTSAVAGPPTAFRDLNSLTSWATIYDEFIATVIALRQAGYGVYIVGHLVRKWLPGDDDTNKLFLEHTITSAFHKRIMARVDFILAITAIPDKATKITQVPIILGGKHTGQFKKKEETHDFNRHYLVTTSPRLEGVTKCRFPLPSPWQIPKFGAWEAFVDMYLKSASVVPGADTNTLKEQP